MKLFFGEIFPEVKINEDEQAHILKVLRMKSGEEIFLTDGKGNLAQGKLVLEGKKSTINVLNIKENLP
jgi:16S rRNA (uracil1498-N3)-methyltransferase